MNELAFLFGIAGITVGLGAVASALNDVAAAIRERGGK